MLKTIITTGPNSLDRVTTDSPFCLDRATNSPIDNIFVIFQ